MLSKLNTLAHKLLPSWIYSRLIGNWDRHGFKKYLSNTGWALLTRIFSLFVSFFVSIYLIRYLGPENYGQLSYAVSFVGLFSIIASFGLDTVLYRDLIKYPEKRNEYLGSALVIKLVTSIVATSLLILSTLLFSHDDVSRTIILLLATTFIFNSFVVIGYEFQANVAQKYTSLMSLGVIFILNILKLVVIWLGEGILYIGVILLLEAIFYALGYIFLRIRHYGSLFAWRFDWQITKQLLNDSLPFILITVFTTIYARIDQVMLKHLMDSSAVGLYDAAVRIAEVWLFIPAIIASSLFPAIVNAKKISGHEYKKRLLVLSGLMGSLGLIVAIISSLFAGPIITTLYGPLFVASIGVFIVYVWAGVFASVDIVLRYFLVSENMKKTIFFTTCGTAVLNVALNIILIPHFGIAGAAWSTLISYAVLSIPFIMVIKIKD